MSDHRAGPGWGSGSDGQRAAAAALAVLPPTAKFFHGLPMGRSGSTIDHLVIGPTGAWVVDSVFWTGAITATSDGMLWRGKESLLPEVDRMLERSVYAKRALGIDVHPVLCVVGARLPLPRHRIGGVDIVDVQWLVTLITAHPPTLLSAELDLVTASVARWRLDPPPYVAARLASAEVAATAPRRGARPAFARRSVSAGATRTPTAVQAMTASAAIALTMAALIAFMMVRGRDDATASLSGNAAVRTAAPTGRGAVRIDVTCDHDSGDYLLVGRVRSIDAARVRVSATLDGRHQYLGEFSSLQRTPTLGGIPAGASTGFDVQLVDGRERGGEISHFEVTTPSEACPTGT